MLLSILVSFFPINVLLLLVTDGFVLDARLEVKYTSY